MNRVPTVACSIIGLVLTIGATGCTTWRPEQTVPVTAPELRITLSDGSRMVLHQVGLEGDSLVGFEWVAASPVSRHRRLAFACADVRRIEKRRFEPVRTVALVGASTAIVVWIAVSLENFKTAE